MVALFTLTSIVTAALLFLVQPMVARMVLPAFGGSPQVWTTAMLFFQTALLAGYAYTHFATNRLKRRAQLGIHLIVLAIPLILLPIFLTVEPSGRGGIAPSLELLLALTLSVAAPFVVIATSGPLVQRWFSWTNHRHAQDPYFLYAAGNIGSIGGLLAYPFFIEPNLSVIEQTRWWMYGYWLAIALLSLCALTVWRKLATVSDNHKLNRMETHSTTAPIQAKRIAYWLLLAFVPSSLMLGVTAHLATDVASIPMLWVLPLVAYLLTFTIAFSRFGGTALRLATWLAPVVIVSAISLKAILFGTNLTIAIQILLVLVGGLIGHGKLAEDRPDPSQLTRFYLTMSIGGALGGLFNGLVAPVIFPHVFEYGIILTATLGLVTVWGAMVPGFEKFPRRVWMPIGLILFLLPIVAVVLVETKSLPTVSWQAYILMGLLILPLFFSVGKSPLVFAGVAIASLLPSFILVSTAKSIERTFFGVHRVAFDEQKNLLMLAHGTTVHGMQDMSSEESRQEALVYYHRDQPCGDLITQLPEQAQLGVVGLGAGTIAAYGNSQRPITFLEIDPAIVRIAEEQFTYLADARARGTEIMIELGDGRLTLQDKSQVFDLLIVDAFSSDSIPVHLLTLEAIEVYLKSIKSEGMIGIHISNRYLDLMPVLAGAAKQLNLTVLQRIGTDAEKKTDVAHWVVLGRDAGRLESFREMGWSDLPEKKIVWTDQRSSLWSIRKK